MSKYFRGKRTRNFYQPGQPFNLSRSKIELFVECARCFYIDRRLGLGRPPGFPFTLQSKVDAQMKAEFDAARETGQVIHYLEGTNMRPAEHPDLDVWRSNFKGVTRQYRNLTISGAIDDLWIDDDSRFAPADYKATATKEVVDHLDPVEKEHHRSYIRQGEIYCWLLEDHLPMSGYCHWLYFTAADKEAVGPTLTFEHRLISHLADRSWIENTLDEIIACLDSPKIPLPGTDCDYCRWHDLVRNELSVHPCVPEE